MVVSGDRDLIFNQGGRAGVVVEVERSRRGENWVILGRGGGGSNGRNGRNGVDLAL